MSATSITATTSFTVMNFDAEAQHIVATSHSLPAPGQALAHSPRTPAPALEAIADPLDDFFGYAFISSRTHESRHDRRLSDVPPPYVEESNLPAYTRNAPEHVTLAMYLFKFGFLFPPFWFFGALILISPLREPPSSPASPAWMPEKTESEREQLIADIRKVELKWGRRCLFAFIILSIIVIVAAVSAWAILRK